MNRDIGFVMDPLDDIQPAKDSTLAMMLAAQARGWRIEEIHPASLTWRDGRVAASMRRVRVADDPQHWYTAQAPREVALTDLDAVMMRKDPPFDMDYIYATYLLEQAEAAGVPVINRPRALRDANEKLFTLWFPQCCPRMLVAADHAALRAFIEDIGDTIVKPLDGMGGRGVCRLHPADPNINAVLELLTEDYRRPIMAQAWLPAIEAGDKRVLLVDGEPLDQCLARLPAANETRANLAAGGGYRTQPLSDHDRWICSQVAPALRERGLVFVGLDIIGEHLTEINVTSPTCIREIARDAGIDAAELLLDAVAERW